MMRRALWFCLLVVQPLVAAESPTPLLDRPILDVAPIKEAAKNVAAAETHSAKTAQFTYALGSGLSFYRGNFARENNFGLVALNVEAIVYTYPFESRDVMVGADLGIDFWNEDVKGEGVTKRATGLRLFPTIVYTFSGLIRKDLSPYIGASIGPYLYTARVQPLGSQSSIKSETQVLLMLSMRPGITWQIVPDFALGFESRLALIGSDFGFFPTVSAQLSL